MRLLPPLQVSPASIHPCELVEVRYSVSNTGKVTGDEVTQVYMSFKVRKRPGYDSSWSSLDRNLIIPQH